MTIFTGLVLVVAALLGIGYELKEIREAINKLGSSK